MAYSRTEQLIAYLAQQHPRATVTVLMKLAYLIDLSAIENKKKPVSAFEYRRYNYGPFDEAIYSTINKLVDGNVLMTEAAYGLGGSEYIVYKFNDDMEDFNFKKLKPHMAMINKVLKALNGFGAKTLTSIAYKTKPMLALGATLGGNEAMNTPLNLKAK